MNEDSKYDIFSIIFWMPRRVYGLKRRGLGRVEGLVEEVEIMQAGLARTSKHPTSRHNCWACRVVLECTYRSRMGVVRRRICHCLSPEGTKGHCSQHTMTIELVNSWPSKCVLPNIRIYAKAGLRYKLIRRIRVWTSWHALMNVLYVGWQNKSRAVPGALL